MLYQISDFHSQAFLARMPGMHHVNQLCNDQKIAIFCLAQNNAWIRQKLRHNI